jgi:hypothetical protein
MFRTFYSYPYIPRCKVALLNNLIAILLTKIQLFFEIIFHYLC